jgi:hypothetical protein
MVTRASKVLDTYVKYSEQVRWMLSQEGYKGHDQRDILKAYDTYDKWAVEYLSRLWIFTKYHHSKMWGHNYMVIWCNKRKSRIHNTAANWVSENLRAIAVVYKIFEVKNGPRGDISLALGIPTEKRVTNPNGAQGSSQQVPHGLFRASGP